MRVGALVRFDLQTYEAVPCSDTLIRNALDRAGIPNREFHVRSLKKEQRQDPGFLCYFKVSEDLQREIIKRGNLLRVGLQLLEVRYPDAKRRPGEPQGATAAGGGSGTDGQRVTAQMNQPHPGNK